MTAPQRSLPRLTTTARLLSLAVYPILPWQTVPGGKLIGVEEELGTGFFVTVSGMFLTAKHVVERHVTGGPLRMLVFDKDDTSFWPCEIEKLELHPSIDVAAGMITLPFERRPIDRLTLSLKRLRAGDPVAAYGYSHTRPERSADGGATSITVHFNPRDHHGRIEERHPEGFLSLKGTPCYSSSALTGGGISGGPLVSRQTRYVHGINSRGLETAPPTPPLGLAIDLRAFAASWPLEMLGGLTLRDFARRYPKVIRLDE